MDIYTDTIRDLGPAEKLRLVEQIWDDLAAEESPLPLPDWAVTEAVRRRDEPSAWGQAESKFSTIPAMATGWRLRRNEPISLRDPARLLRQLSRV